MAESFSKKEKQKKKIQLRETKAEKMRERKAALQKGRPLEEMMAYLDENGNLSSTPPGSSLQQRNDQKSNHSYNRDNNGLLTGKVSFYNTAKGFGFIFDSYSRKRIFVHSNYLQQPVEEGDEVLFEVRKTEKGLTAFNVRKKN